MVAQKKAADLKHEKNRCTHCDLPCDIDFLIQDNHHFCCQGCLMVYQILKENGLGQFYEMENGPGTSMKGHLAQDFQYLDDPEIRCLYIDFENDNLSRAHFLLPQIHCTSCVWLLEQLGRLNPHIVRSQVNFLKKEVHITFDGTQLPLSELAATLAKIGYAPTIRLSDTEKTKAVVDRSLYFKLGVAGFLFGNIMLFSFPEYLGLEASTDPFLKHCFAYLNLLLGIPLMLYGGRDYLYSAYLGLRQRQLNMDVPISIGLLALFGRSAYEVLMQSGAGYFDSLAGLIFFLLVGKWFQQQTYYRLSFERDYKSYFPLTATVIEAQGTRQLPLDRLAIGQRLLIREGTLIPADGRLLKGKAEIDYSFVTGEADPVSVEVGATIYAGGRQRGAAIEIAVQKKTNQSYLIQLWNEKVFEQKEKNIRMDKLANRVGSYFTWAILCIAFFTLLFWLIVEPDLAMNAFTAVLIIACPCALALAIPFTFGNAIRLLAQSGLILKNTNSLEAMQQLTHLVFDKTGTLTESQSETLTYQGDLSDSQRLLIRSLVHHSAHPKSRQIENQMGQGALMEVLGFEEQRGQGIVGMIDGHEVKIGSAPFVNGGKEGKGTYVKIDGQLIGCFQSTSTIRLGMTALIADLQQDYEVSLLSGDDEKDAKRFRELLGTEAALRFHQSPKDKLQYIEQLQQKGAVVMMIGDGLNDAGALQQADVGLVLTEQNNHFVPACDAIVQSEKLSSLATELQYIRRIRWVVYGAFAIALLYNVLGLSFAVQALLSPVIAAVLMPVSSLTIVIFGVLGSRLLRGFGNNQSSQISDC